jgi:hypothetical protein
MKAILGLVLLLAAVAPPEAEVQGLYEGTLKDAKVEARVVALGKDAYKIYVRETSADGKLIKAELDGKAEGDAVAFKNKSGEVEWTATYAPGLVKGTAGGIAFEFKRVQRKPPSMGKAPPAGAIVLLDGKNFDEVTKSKSEEDWKPADDGSIQVPKGGMNSKRQFDGSYDLHVEFLCPLMPAARGPGQRSIPPSKLNRWWKPCSARKLQAERLRWPCSATTAIGVPPFTTSPTRVGSSCKGIRIEPGMCASAYSLSVRTSSRQNDSPIASFS